MWMIVLMAAVVSQPFNLRCKMLTSASTVNGQPVELNIEQEPDILRIDISSRRWCKDSCMALGSLRESENYISINRADLDDMGNNVVDQINRRTGYRIFSVTDKSNPELVHWINTYQCEKAAFTGFPRKKF